MTFTVEIESGLGDSLYRAYESLEYATMFIEGYFRIQLLAEYQKIESKSRVDEEEGVYRYLTCGVNRTPVINSGSWMNPIFVLCCASTSVDLGYLRNKYGEHVVEIGNMEGFVAEVAKGIDAALGENRELISIYLCRVRYNKGDIQPVEPTTSERDKMMWAQKPQRFSRDCEIRLVAIVSGGSKGIPSHLDIRVQWHKTKLRRLNNGIPKVDA